MAGMFVSDYSRFETWEDAGAVDTQARANKIWKQLLNDYEQPSLDPAIDEELSDYVEKRKAGSPIE